MKYIVLIVGCFLLAACSSMPGMDYFSNQDAAQSDVNDEVGSSDAVRGIVDVQTQAPAQSAFAQSGMQQSQLPQQNKGQIPQAGGIDAFGSIEKPNMIGSTPGAFKSLPLTRHVGYYVRNMAQDLVGNMEYVTERTPVAVTHFSLIDSDLRETNLLGQQMAESFVHEFHKFRMPVVEFKATQFIRVTETGDYVLSRDFLDLNNNTPIQYVLTGTMTKHQGGYIVNARMLGMESKVVVASAQSFIPFYVVDALIPSESSRQNEVVDGVRIIRGE
uniref:FlgO family outer membrane protein n=1 Tax=Ningiella ruwaisensis TaxID=2364274 RepID=UPI00109FDCEC|nr:FlgO family outer membrane protein [Ningiella ruwaisensis]